jgi:hypothetical protein
LPFNKEAMSPGVALDLEVATVVAVAALIVALSCRLRRGPCCTVAADMERPLNDPMLVPYAQTVMETMARQR